MNTRKVFLFVILFAAIFIAMCTSTSAAAGDNALEKGGDTFSVQESICASETPQLQVAPLETVTPTLEVVVPDVSYGNTWQCQPYEILEMACPSVFDLTEWNKPGTYCKLTCVSYRGR